jgi:predicted ATPase
VVFSIKSILANLPRLGYQRLYFNTLPAHNSNITIMIGENGSGKSTLLREILYWARQSSGSALRRRTSERRILEDVEVQPSSPFNLRDSPNRVIALSFTPFDKFPPRDDIAIQASRSVDHGELISPYYVYLGFKNQYGSTGSRSKLLQLIQTVVFEKHRENFHTGISHVLRHINYEPSIRVRYRLTSRFKSYLRLEDQYQNGSQEVFDQAKTSFSEKFHLNAQRYLRDPIVHHWYYHPPEISVDLEKDMFSTAGQRHIFDHYSTHDDKEISMIQEMVSLGLMHLHEAQIYSKDNPDGWIDLFQLSSGELNIIVAFLGLGIYLVEGSLVLIDEPENSLHPAWQEKYSELLSAAFEGIPDCQFILATHSPIILSGISKNGASVVRLDKSPCNIDSATFEGMASDAALVNGFGVVIEGNSYLRQLALEALTLIRTGEGGSVRFKAIQSVFSDHIDSMDQDDPLNKLAYAILDHG